MRKSPNELKQITVNVHRLQNLRDPVARHLPFKEPATKRATGVVQPARIMNARYQSSSTNAWGLVPAAPPAPPHKQHLLCFKGGDTRTHRVERLGYFVLGVCVSSPLYKQAF
jgi:hypothetical protein